MIHEVLQSTQPQGIQSPGQRQTLNAVSDEIDDISHEVLSLRLSPECLLVLSLRLGWRAAESSRLRMAVSEAEGDL